MSRFIGLACVTGLLAAGLLGAGACSSDTSYTVGGHTLVVKDSGYVSTPSYYCLAAAPGQLLLTIVDFNPICGGAIDADGGSAARDSQLEHNELQLLFVTSAHDDPKLPYDVSPPDCTVGPAGPGIATFRHFASGSTTPDETPAQSGQIFLTTIDPTGVQPATGKFNLSFGAAGSIDGTFSTYTCNP